MGDKILVDKTPWYALDVEVLKRAEDYFDGARYIHLLRDPYASIHSFEEARLDQIFRYPHDFSTRELAELVWHICNQNILDFFKEVPSERKLIIKFEDIVQEPADAVREICRFLGIEYREEMVRVYENAAKKMTDGIHPESKMLGDIKFFTHSGIDTSVTEKWKKRYKSKFLGDVTVNLAQSLGYLQEKAVLDYSQLERAPELEYYELSHGQRRLWVLAQLEENQIAYNVPQVLALEGDINREILAKVFEAVIRRHESLRTTFIVVGGQPRQKINDFESLGFKLEYIDLRGRRDVEKEVKTLVDKEIAKVFDLQRGPLIRAKLFQLAEKKYAIFFNMHHIICDGWSMRLLVNELLILYGVYRENKESPLEPLVFQYKDYSYWQTSDVGRAAVKLQESFWLEEFSGDIPVLNLPTDFPRPPVQSFEGNAFTFEVGEDQTRKLLEFALRGKVTLYMLLLSVYAVFLAKLSGQEDVIVGTGIAGRRHPELRKVIGMFVNTLALRTYPIGMKTFQAFLQEVRAKTLPAFDYQDYPFDELVDKVVTTRDRARNPLVDAVFLLQNVELETDEIPQVEVPGLKSLPFVSENLTAKFDISFYCSEIGNRLSFTIDYCTKLFKKETINRFSAYFKTLISSIIEDPGRNISMMGIIPAEEKKQILCYFNDTAVPGTMEEEAMSIHQLFEEQARRNPEVVAVSSPIDISDIFAPTSCFKKNTFIFESDLGIRTFKLLKTNSNNNVVINQHMLRLIDCFTGENNLESIFSIIKDFKAAKFVIFTAQMKDMLGVTYEFNRQADVFSNMKYSDFISLVQLLHKNKIIKMHGVKSQTTLPGMAIPDQDSSEAHESFDDRSVLKDLLTSNESGFEKAEVLLLGDTHGMPTTGLLYIASFLRRHGVKTLCRFYDGADNFQSMAADIEKILERIQPRVVGISMKWFLYIARVVEMGKIIKEYSRRHGLDIKVVVGGNTASYYWKEIIAYDFIDYIVRGDGEEPLLKIFRGEKDIPNCIYKENGEIIENPITYIQDEKSSSEIYLSHLDEILIDKPTSLFGTFFVYTQKGCAMNCLYCGGCNKAQQKAFNRKNVLRRGIEETRKDIIEVKKYTSTFHFEFDILDKNLANYCRKIWKGIDLSGHFCLFNTLTPPSIELVELVSQTFKYVYWDFDICTPSERHRKQLETLGLVKPQPSDAQIIDFLATCERFKNIEVRPNLITGLPYFTVEDIEPGEKLLTEIMSTFSCFSELHWARLHAQPGAPILEYAEELRMYSFANSFDDFLKYSRENFNRDSGNGYVSVENFNYPYIYFRDDHLNSRVTNFYLEINKKLDQHKNDRENDQIISETLTYRELNERADRLAAILIARGVKPGDIVGLILERSIAIPVGILAVLKCGAAYLPIDPEFPPGRVEYMLKDSGARILLKKSDMEDAPGEIFHHSSSIIHHSSHFAYIIYTSGTTGKPKGVAIRHENVVNYVNWFSGKVGLTGQDKTILTTSFAFDLGYTSLYNSLLNGCELHILPREIYLLAERLLSYIKQNKITFIKVTPSLFSVIVNSPGFSKITCQTLRLAAMGGEPINVRDIEKAHSLCSHLEIMNHYGPTETTIGSAAAIIDFADFEEYKAHPVIGKPIANAGIYILGKDLDLLPVGVPGELCISGAGVGVGYLNQPELTAERFNRSYKSYIIYKTGDLARWLPNGTIEFLGRIDNQVKVRGYRIELGEIESRLAKHPAVEEAVVVVKDQKEIDGKYICAYIVTAAHRGNAAAVAAITGDKNKQALPVKGNHRATVTQFVDHARTKYNEIAVKSNDRSLTYGELNNVANRVAQEITAKYDDRYRLSKKERTRYKRQMLLHGWGIESQEKLKSTTVFVAGAGGGASPTIVQLALAGIGTIKVCDFDEVELSNLNRQFLHDEERLGMNKALSAQVTVGKINPHVKVIPYTGKLTRDNVFELVGDADIIFDMFDGLADKFVLSEYAVVKRIPHIIISMTDINAYTAVCHTPQTPCYHCLFDRKKLETIVSGMQNQVENYSKNPLPVVATSLFISTGIAVNEALKILLGFKKPAYNKFFYFNQRGEEENLVYTPGYKAMTYLFSDHFLQVCKEQGFDWDSGWRGNFLEELAIKPDPGCPLCGDEGKELRQALEKKIKKPVRVTIKEKDEVKGQGESLKTVGLLFDPGIEMAAAIMATLKAGKSIVPIDPVSPDKNQLTVLEDSEVRVILTDDLHFKLAESLKDKYNRNIKIINISINTPNETGPVTEKTIRVEEDVVTDTALYAYLLYPTHPMGNPKFNTEFADLYAALVEAKETFTFVPADHRALSGATPLSDQLREYLREQLPDYMVPVYFVPLAKIPLTPNGKLDRKALPDPVQKEESDFRAPGNELEEKLAEIWAGVLGIKKDIIGIDTNFFGLGGHSLNATILVSKIHKELNVRLPLVEFFKIPTIKGLSGYIMAAEEENFAAIEPAEEKEYYKSSSSQKRLYVLQQIEENSIAWNVFQAFPLGQEVEKEKLIAVFNRLIARHETLRTSFEMIGGEPVQRIHKYSEWNLQFYKIDETDWGYVERNFRKPFDLSKAPLLRVGLVETEPPSHYYYLVVEMHHIVSDEVSQILLQNEFKALYAGEELPALRLQYKDYSEWQNSQEQQLLIQEQERYWLEVFSDEVPVLNLPNDYPRPVMQSAEGNTVDFLLSGKERFTLNELVKETGATVYMCILSIFTILLSRLSGQEDIVIGTPIAARRHADLEKIIGMFVNALTTRNTAGAEKRYKDFLLELKERTLRAYENQEYPFEELVEKISVSRDTSRHPVYDVMFNLVHMEEQDYVMQETEEEEPTQYQHRKATSKVDLTLITVEMGDKLLFSIEYCNQLFKPATIDRFISYFKRLLSSLSEDSDVRLFEMEMISREEKQQILYKFNDTGMKYSKYNAIHELFEKQVEKAPDNIAVIGPSPALIHFSTIQLTYRELNKKSNRLAGYLLKRLSMQPDMLVGILMTRSVKIVEGILAAWKSGAAYIPMDTEDPLERIESILKDSRAAAVITDNISCAENLRRSLKLDVPVPILCSEELAMNIEEDGLTNPGIRIGMNDLAYVIYTSGSTGKPKGAMVMHVGMMNHMYCKIKDLNLDAGSVIAQNASHCFDISVWQFFAALVVGGRTVIYNRELVLNSKELIHRIGNDGLTILEMVPSHLSVLLDTLDAENEYSPHLFGRLQYLVVTGEALKPVLVNRWFKRFRHIRLVNAYGPTEASDDITHYIMSGPQDTNNIPLGMPLYNLKIYIVDKQFNLCPVGVKGEILVSGIGVGRGYLNDVSKTHDSFVKDPFREESGMRLYKTGDIGRYLEDGRIEFFGRKDYQLKIRGFRIELGEIESRLLNHPLIKETVVITWEEEVGDKYMCAYFVSGMDLTASELKAYLAKDLPGYMIPAHFVRLEKIPLNPNGKIDRKALPKPGLEAGEGYVAPQNEVEEKLLELWADILIGSNSATLAQRIGIDDNFFQLGGHSLKAVMLVTKISKDLNVKISLADIFTFPTIRGLARHIAGLTKVTFEAIEIADEREYYPLSTTQRGVFIQQQKGAAVTAYNLPNLLNLDFYLDKERLEKSIKKLLQRHESLRTSFFIVHNEPVQKILSDVEFAIQYYDHATEDEIKGIIANFVKPFDLASPPLVRIGLIRRQRDKFILLFDMHHIVTDGVSSDIFGNEVMALYRGEDLLPQRIQYKDYSVWQNSTKVQEEIKKQKAFWLGTFAGEIPLLKLPLDFERPPVRDFSGNQLNFIVDSELTSQLNQLLKQTDTTLYMVLLASYFILLSMYANQEDIIVGSPITGRRHADLYYMIGMFVNMLAIRNQPERKKHFRDFLSEVKKSVLDCMENQDYHFEELVTALGLQGDPSRTPLFDVVFSMQNIGDANTVNQNAAEAGQPEKSGDVFIFEVSRFDLLFHAVPTHEIIKMKIEYSTRLFKRSTIEDIAKHYLEILQQITSDVSIKLDEIKLSYELAVIKSTGIQEEGSFGF
ncbi:MAG TPA: amino acid adenylation domain-containing protein [Candidatus Kapabacteria bacterium]|nr:amino acid adenylation domain-containing protein [Candidatus Kapabacteria bacterium]